MEDRKVNIGQDYFEKQWKNEEFSHSYWEEKGTLDIECKKYLNSDW